MVARSEAVVILGEAEVGIVTFDDKFKESCRMGKKALINEIGGDAYREYRVNGAVVNDAISRRFKRGKAKPTPLGLREALNKTKGAN